MIAYLYEMDAMDFVCATENHGTSLRYRWIYTTRQRAAQYLIAQSFYQGMRGLLTEDGRFSL